MAKKETLRDWFSKNKGTGWVDCKTGKPCGRKKGEKRGYPACRPTMAECKKAGAAKAIKKKTSSKRVSWQKKSKGGKVKKLKPIPPGNKGLPKLPKEVRNKMGYFVEGGRAEKKKGGNIARGCGKVMSNRRKYTTIS